MDINKLITDNITSSEYEFNRMIDTVVDKVERHNYKYDDDIEVDDFIDNIIERRIDYIEENLEFQKDIFQEKINSYVTSYNIRNINTTKNGVRVNIDSLSGVLRIPEDAGIFGKVFMRKKEKIRGEFNYNYQKFKYKIISHGLVFYYGRDKPIKTATSRMIDDVAYFMWNGESIRQLEYVLNEYGYTILDFIFDLYCLNETHKERFTLTRIDISYDDDSGLFNLERIRKKVKNNEYKSSFKNKPVMINDGETIYFGHKQRLMLRIYDKTLETIKKNKLTALEHIKDELPQIVRMELQLRGPYAKTFLEDAVIYANTSNNALAEVGRSWLCKKITFLSETKGVVNKNRVPIAPFWREFSSCTLNVKATFERPKTTIENSVRNVYRKRKSLAAVKFLKEYSEKNPDKIIKYGGNMKGLLNATFKFKDVITERYVISDNMAEKLLIFAQIIDDDELIKEIKEKTTGGLYID